MRRLSQGDGEGARSPPRALQKSDESFFYPLVVADMIAPGKIAAINSPDVCGAWVGRDLTDDSLSLWSCC